jgi:hypothetical protein
LEPEQVLVLEIAGELTDFAKAVAKVPGLEFLAEEIEDKVEPDEFAAVDHKGKRHRYDRQLFLVASDHKAWQQLLSLWERFQRGERFERGLTPFEHLFSRLRELRPWDDRDRLGRSGALDAWRQEFSSLGDELVEFEAELWLRSNEDRRNATAEAFKQDLEAVGGELVAQTVHEEIGYHGVLGRVPASLLRSAVEHEEVRWLKTESVRFFHAVGQMAAVDLDQETTEAVEGNASPVVDRAPRIALLDGVPLAQHVALADRLILDDPEDWEATTAVRRRVHGTGMASLVLHGDMGAEGVPLRDPIYVRPILKAQAPDWLDGDGREELPRDRLAIDVVQSAFARLFEGDAMAPSTRVVIIAIGDAVLQFDRFVSPLARLLDWLADRYGVLIVVSAGNHVGELRLPADIDLDSPEELQHEILCALQREAGMRRVLSPGESVNAITVGAAHTDESGVLVDDGRVDPLLSEDLSSVVSALGLGPRRSIKPDVLFPGGRQVMQVEPSDGDSDKRLSVSVSRRPPGVKMATASAQAGNLAAAAHGTGTSIATALAGHRAGRLLEQLDDLRGIYGDKIAGPEFDSVLLKAALTHGASWGAAHALIDDCREDLERGRSRAAVSRLVGYGRAGVERTLACDGHRATALGAGRISDGQADVFQLPLPPSLASKTVQRRITLTLAWITPINVGHRHYRRAALKVEPKGFSDFLGKRTDADNRSTMRGTLQHEVFEGRRATPFVAGNAIELVVSCRADAGTLSVSVPYALIVTVEIAESAELKIYEEVREALHVPIQVQTRSR